MSSRDHIDDEDDFGGDFAGENAARRSGTKRSFGDLDDDEDDIFGSKKANLKVEETAPGVATGMILSLRESLKNCQDELSRCQTNLEDAKSEIQQWRSSFQNESFIPQGATPEPRFVVSYLQTLRSSDESMREHIERAKKKEAAFIVTFAKREQEIAELKSALRESRAQLKPPSMQARRLLLDPAIHDEFTRLKNLVEEKDKKIKELQDNIAAVSFTPQSKMGKMLMAKCRTLQEENEEIGNQANEGKIHELAMKLALQKSQNVEVRSQLEGLCKLMEKVTGDVDRSNELVVIMQEKLEEKEDEIRQLKLQLQDTAGNGKDQDNGCVEEEPEVAIDDDAKDEGPPSVEVKTEN
ncbi:FKBP12-interacting protein of 37 kDa [Salvia hispanica]|uniref:FKBP12-interacting protein of 37 kDa n=1 Tax=Salvia hispanica TaxID=49212 RepID=UPI0020095E9A|nr:FKBP12-interacting protein of 37 kDa [Salvia hispanica]